MKKSFSITPRVIAHLGEDLIKNESIALLELVKNSYDAGASHCHVHFQFVDAKVARIEIEDDGSGMNADTIENVWLVIGTDYKFKQLQERPNGRVPLGEKGIGRLGVHKLGRKIQLISKTGTDKEVVLSIDWSQLDAAREIDDFSVEVSENDTPVHFKDDKKGTLIIVEELKTEWDRRQLREVYRNLMSLNSPFAHGNDGFSVEVSSNSDVFQGLPSFSEIVENGGMYFGHCVMEGGEITDFRYEFKPWRTLEKIGRRVILHQDWKEKHPEDFLLLGWRVPDGKTTPESYPIDLTAMKIGRVEFDIVIFEKEPAVFKLMSVEPRTVTAYLQDNGGIRVYRDNVRVYDYGERDNDWLGIDLRRVHRVGGNVSNNIILGSVRLQRVASTGLREKTNREGFIEDDVYHAFVDAVNFALSLMVRFRNEDKERLTALYKSNRVTEPVLSDLREVTQLVQKCVKKPSDRDEILGYLNRIDKQYGEVKEVLIRSANAGLNLGVVIHEIDKMVAALKGHAERGERQQVIDISLRLEKIVTGYMVMVKKSDVKTGALNKIVNQALDNYEFRFLDHDISIVGYDRKRLLNAQFAESQAISILTNLLDNAVFWLSFARKESRALSIFLTDQIRGFNSIVVSDNGPGFNIGTDVAIKPFVSGKPNAIGSGLGLHIANEVMNAMKGKLMFLEEQEINLPPEAISTGATKAIVALCFPKKG
ncbi:MAG: sensor histidine kinase [Kiritimatiellae bacterium]|nr:sensor histidine kinase [Kiritimatiellia bacterium]